MAGRNTRSFVAMLSWWLGASAVAEVFELQRNGKSMNSCMCERDFPLIFVLGDLLRRRRREGARSEARGWLRYGAKLGGSLRNALSESEGLR